MIIPFKCNSVRVTSPYGNRVLGGVSEMHGGYDMVGIGSDVVVAVSGGVVAQSQIVASGKTAEWGNYVCIKTDGGQYHYYCHLKSRAVNKGDRVKAGDKIGIMGATGKVYGAHLHFEVRMGDGKTKISPEGVLDIPNAAGVYEKSSFERDLEVLAARGVISTPEYWRTQAEKVQYLKELIHNFVVQIEG